MTYVIVVTREMPTGIMDKEYIEVMSPSELAKEITKQKKRDMVQSISIYKRDYSVNKKVSWESTGNITREIIEEQQ